MQQHNGSSIGLAAKLARVETPQSLQLAVPYGGRQDARLEPKYIQDEIQSSAKFVLDGSHDIGASA
jgi:hypothetical protein